MKASVTSIRIAPKKANIIARMVRGMPVPVAMEALRRTHKKAARIVELLLRSAIANASHNDKQSPQTMVIKTIVVNQGQPFHRGVPMARGRMRPMKKYLSHISLTLGFPGDETPTGKKAKDSTAPKKSTDKSGKASSQSAKTPVKTSRSPAKADKKSATATSKSSDSSVSSDSSASPSA